eukprot:3680441-Pyramimonas_sp.AAC.1
MPFLPVGRLPYPPLAGVQEPSCEAAAAHLGPCGRVGDYAKMFPFKEVGLPLSALQGPSSFPFGDHL